MEFKEQKFYKIIGFDSEKKQKEFIDAQFRRFRKKLAVRNLSFSLLLLLLLGTVYFLFWELKWVRNTVYVPIGILLLLINVIEDSLVTLFPKIVHKG